MSFPLVPFLPPPTYTLFNSFDDTGIFQYFDNDIEHANVSAI